MLIKFDKNDEKSFYVCNRGDICKLYTKTSQDFTENIYVVYIKPITGSTIILIETSDKAKALIVYNKVLDTYELAISGGML